MSAPPLLSSHKMSACSQRCRAVGPPETLGPKALRGESSAREGSRKAVCRACTRGSNSSSRAQGGPGRGSPKTMLPCQCNWAPGAASGAGRPGACSWGGRRVVREAGGPWAFERNLVS